MEEGSKRKNSKLMQFLNEARDQRMKKSLMMNTYSKTVTMGEKKVWNTFNVEERKVST